MRERRANTPVVNIEDLIELVIVEAAGLQQQLPRCGVIMAEQSVENIHSSHARFLCVDVSRNRSG
jgi:hypothetical protein